MFWGRQHHRETSVKDTRQTTSTLIAERTGKHPTHRQLAPECAHALRRVRGAHRHASVRPMRRARAGGDHGITIRTGCDVPTILIVCDPVITTRTRHVKPPHAAYHRALPALRHQRLPEATCQLHHVHATHPRPNRRLQRLIPAADRVRRLLTRRARTALGTATQCTRINDSPSLHRRARPPLYPSAAAPQRMEISVSATHGVTHTDRAACVPGVPRQTTCRHGGSEH
jgi:hypothetical protein